MSCTLTSRTRSLTHALTRESKLARRSKHARMGGRAHLLLGERRYPASRTVPSVLCSCARRSAPSCDPAHPRRRPPRECMQGCARHLGWGLGFGVWGWRIRLWTSGFGDRALGVGVRVGFSGFRGAGFGFRV